MRLSLSFTYPSVFESMKPLKTKQFNFEKFKVAFLLALILNIANTLDSSAQTRKYFSQFNQLQSYFNPALTGYEGSIVRGLVRNQWTGFEGAPQTYFLSAELDPMEMQGEKDAALLGNTAAGLNLIHDNFGPFRQTEMLLSYGARVRISRTTNLRMGVAANYSSVRLDGNNLTTEQANDPTVNAFVNQYANMQILDFNFGLALTHQNYYFAYGIQNVASGRVNRGDVFIDKKPFVNIFQTGFRQAVSSQFTVLTNFIYRMQSDLPSNFEANIRLLMMDKFWVGAGHRVSYANSYQVGFLMSNIRFGYAYEMPVSKSYLIPNPTHEFMVSFYLFRKGGVNSEAGTLIW
ncbi:type IX secretion system membrane protein PorP/SprF [Shivajiella indica]|uniref:Type IX secretion system membrane protein PorP/SprF n=1 Tax=Shivajiella indica TaxID=872115 RepID=A0ABW5BAH5_9BACT